MPISPWHAATAPYRPLGNPGFEPKLPCQGQNIVRDGRTTDNHTCRRHQPSTGVMYRGIGWGLQRFSRRYPALRGRKPTLTPPECTLPVPAVCARVWACGAERTSSHFHRGHHSSIRDIYKGFWWVSDVH